MLGFPGKAQKNIAASEQKSKLIFITLESNELGLSKTRVAEKVR